MNLREVEVRINKPYPEIVGAVDDKMTVGILKNLASSRAGELPAVLQYVYQSVIADQTNTEIAAILEEIGVVEMIHLDMLMHTITLFGGIPKYEDSQNNYFSTSNLNYSQKLSDMLENNIRAELNAIENYKFAISKVKNESLKELFERIIEDEQRHVEIFKLIRSSVEFLSI